MRNAKVERDRQAKALYDARKKHESITKDLKVARQNLSNQHQQTTSELVPASKIKVLYDEIEEIKNKWNKESSFKFIPVLNMEPEDSDWTGARGMVTDYFENEVVQKENLSLDGWQGYLCGPPPMVDAAGECLTKNGISEDEIFYDKFTDASNS